MFRPLPFIAMRQEQGEATQAAPLGFAGTDELVDDDLRAVDEIAELRLPDHERRRVGGRVTVFETQHRFFRKHGVGNRELRLSGAQVLQRRVALAVFLVVQHRVPMEEGAATAVLPREADRAAVLQQ